MRPRAPVKRDSRNQKVEASIGPHARGPDQAAVSGEQPVLYSPADVIQMSLLDHGEPLVQLAEIPGANSDKRHRAPAEAYLVEPDEEAGLDEILIDPFNDRQRRRALSIPAY